MGNICRSPAAEAIMKHFVKQEDLTNQIYCESAGTSAHHAGRPADPRMTKQAKIKGYNITGISRAFEPEDFNNFDWIVTMDNSNYENVLSLAKKEKDRKKVIKMADFSENCDFIPDPYYGETESFEKIISLLEESCAKLLKKIQTLNE